VLNTEAHLQTDYIVAGKRTSMGTRKWMDVHYYIDPEKCFERVRQNCHRILAAWLGEGAKGLHELDLTQPTAFLFGNEHSGISEPVLKMTDGNFIIPQVGMAESLNISVACAVTLYETYRQRKAAGFYDENLPLPPEEQEALFQEYVRRHEKRTSGRKRIKLTK
ncbi:MAG: TrmH family RNA methyltransferase, partial [Bacteroidota bacterium]